MNQSHPFFQGLLAGALGASAAGLVLLYALNINGWAVIQLPADSSLYALLDYAYANLKLSVIPFALVFIAYVQQLQTLNRQLDAQAPLDTIAQTDHLVDTCIHLFFGIGVIWTAIGMRSALLFALGDPDAVASEGAFALLQRMVDGGILLALSTTIFGGVGGYLMRLFKSVTLGLKLQRYINQHLNHPGEQALQTLQRIEQQLKLLAQNQPPPPNNP